MIYPEARPISVQVLQDRDIVLTEVFPEEWLAMSWAHAYANRLKEQGWQESPRDVRVPSKDLPEQRHSRDP